MLKMVIKFDDEQIKKDNYSGAREFYDIVNGMFKKRNLDVREDGVYTDNGKEDGEEDDLFNFMVLAGVLLHTDWFVKHVEQWLWYEESDVPSNLIQKFEIAR